MKNNSIIYLLLLLAMGFLGGCTEERNLDPEGKWSLSSPTAVSPSGVLEVVLDENSPDETIPFEWTEAQSSAGYGVYYSIVVDTLGSTNFDSPILEIPSGNGGRNLSGSIAYAQLDEALSLAGFQANQLAEVTWAVKANCLGKSSTDGGTLKATRFATEILPDQLFLTGSATEAGSDLSNALGIKMLSKDEQSLNRFELYTHLEAGKTFEFFSQKSKPAHRWGGAEGILVKSGQPLSVETSGTYRISVNLNNYSYEILPIGKWSVVGSPVAGGWNGDEPLVYQGGSVWRASVNLVDKGGFIFRANGDWAYLFKRIKGTSNSLVMESQASDQGLAFEDIPSDKIGQYVITLNLSAGNYQYSIERDPTGAGPIEAPEQLYLLAGNILVAELQKEGSVFTTSTHVALQKEVEYVLNSKSDGSGTGYSIDASIGATTSLGSDKVTGNANMIDEAGAVLVEYDQMFKLTFDFETSKLIWSYYNIKLFHWKDWDARNEFVMSYQHPYTFTLVQTLKAGYDMKFISPWDVEMGSDTPAALSGNLINKGGSNIVCIPADGSYKATIQVSPSFDAGTYLFESN